MSSDLELLLRGGGGEDTKEAFGAPDGPTTSSSSPKKPSARRAVRAMNVSRLGGKSPRYRRPVKLRSFLDVDSAVDGRGESTSGSESSEDDEEDSSSLSDLPDIVVPDDATIQWMAPNDKIDKQVRDGKPHFDLEAIDDDLRSAERHAARYEKDYGRAIVDFEDDGTGTMVMIETGEQADGNGEEEIDSNLIDAMHAPTRRLQMRRVLASEDEEPNTSDADVTAAAAAATTTTTTPEATKSTDETGSVSDSMELVVPEEDNEPPDTRSYPLHRIEKIASRLTCSLEAIKSKFSPGFYEKSDIETSIDLVNFSRLYSRIFVLVVRLMLANMPQRDRQTIAESLSALTAFEPVDLMNADAEKALAAVLAKNNHHRAKKRRRVASRASVVATKLNDTQRYVEDLLRQFNDKQKPQLDSMRTLFEKLDSTCWYGGRFLRDLITAHHHKFVDHRIPDDVQHPTRCALSGRILEAGSKVYVCYLVRALPKDRAAPYFSLDHYQTPLPWNSKEFKNRIRCYVVSAELPTPTILYAPPALPPAPPSPEPEAATVAAVTPDAMEEEEEEELPTRIRKTRIRAQTPRTRFSVLPILNQSVAMVRGRLYHTLRELATDRQSLSDDFMTFMNLQTERYSFSDLADASLQNIGTKEAFTRLKTVLACGLNPDAISMTEMKARCMLVFALTRFFFPSIEEVLQRLDAGLYTNVETVEPPKRKKKKKKRKTKRKKKLTESDELLSFFTAGDPMDVDEEDDSDNDEEETPIARLRNHYRIDDAIGVPLSLPLAEFILTLTTRLKVVDAHCATFYREFEALEKDTALHAIVDMTALRENPTLCLDFVLALFPLQ